MLLKDAAVMEEAAQLFSKLYNIFSFISKQKRFQLTKFMNFLMYIRIL